MTDVNGVGTLASSATLREFAHQSFKRTAPSEARNDAGGDQVEISEVAAFLSRLAELPDARARKIVDIRNSIQNGTYTIDDKLGVAVDRLFAEL